MALPSYERLGVFYLGREIDPKSQQLGDELLYDSRDLTTHAICIGMTGSGKTGLCLSLLEEAALDGIPAIAIDPKGDIGNLVLTFPELRPEDFKPWVDAGEASRKGQSVDEFAAATSEVWKKGLAEWNEDGARIARLRDAAEVTIYTPGSDAGRSLSILKSFAAPDPVVAGDATALKERVSSAVGGLLGLLGIEADPIKSREHILLSAILDATWRKGQGADLAAIIQSVQKPPFDKIGVFDLESFYPAKDRMGLALQINGLLASPGFEAWLKGDALDIQKLLYTDAGKPRIAIISIAHLNDAERMFVVTLVANELVAWMRRQSGTTSLRALFYMDEVFGFFPPTAMPPSKTPLLTLMKQARAFGLGVVLATQNPVDLDYKGLGNAGTWFIGRLQTERDKARVIEGLLGTDAAGGLDKAAFDSMMANLSQRTFLMRNVHDDAPVLMRTRWALSYLRGPLTLNEIRQLTPARAASPADQAAPAARAAADAAPSTRPVLQAGVTERFVASPTGGKPLTYQARIGAKVRAHFVDAKAGMDAWESWYYLAPCNSDGPDWSKAEVVADPGPSFVGRPRPERSLRLGPGVGRVATQLQGLGRRARRPRLSHGHRQHVPLPGPEDGLRARRHGERVSRAPRAGLAGEARCGRRRAAQEVLVQAGRDRRSAAPRGTEDRATEVAGDQPDDGHRVVGGRQPARRAVRRAPLECAATGLVRRARHRTRDQGTFRRRGCRGGRGRAARAAGRTQCGTRIRDQEPRIRTRPRDDPDRDGRSQGEEERHRRR